MGLRSLGFYPWQPAHPVDPHQQSHHLAHFSSLPNPLLFISFRWPHGASSPHHLCHIISFILSSLHLSNAGGRQSLSLSSCCLCCSSPVSLAWHAVVPSLELFINFSKKKMKREGKKNYRETPASLKLTVSFPASFLLNTKGALLAFPIINSQESIEQEYTMCQFLIQPKITPDDFTYYTYFSQRFREEEPISGSTCSTLILIKSCRLSAACMVLAI